MKPREILEKYKPDGVKRIQCQFKDANGQPIHPADPKPTDTVVYPPMGETTTSRSPTNWYMLGIANISKCDNMIKLDILLINALWYITAH